MLMYPQAGQNMPFDRGAINGDLTKQNAKNVSGTLSRLDAQITFLREIVSRLDRIADTMSGSDQLAGAQIGSTANAPQEPGRPPYLVGSLEYINSQVGDRIGEIQRNLDRIESALG